MERRGCSWHKDVIKSGHSITHSLHSLHLMAVWHSFVLAGTAVLSWAAYLNATPTPTSTPTPTLRLKTTQLLSYPIDLIGKVFVFSLAIHKLFQVMLLGKIEIELETPFEFPCSTFSASAGTCRLLRQGPHSPRPCPLPCIAPGHYQTVLTSLLQLLCCHKSMCHAFPSSRRRRSIIKITT